MDKDYELFNISVRAKRRAQMGIDIVDGTIGMMMNDQGKAMRLPAVEAELTRCAQYPLSYPPVEGYQSFLDLALKWVLGTAYDRVTESTETLGFATIGGTGALYLAFSYAEKLNYEVLYPQIGWPNYTTIAEGAKAHSRTYETFSADGRFNISAIARIMEEDQKRFKGFLIVINDPCENPTGYTMSQDEVDAVYSLAREKAAQMGTRADLLWDAAYLDFSRSTPAWIASAGANDDRSHTLIAFTASKAFGVYGLRQGALFALFPKSARGRDDRDEMREFLMDTAYGCYSTPNGLASFVVESIMKNPDIKGQIQGWKSILQRRSAEMISALEAHGIPHYPHREGFYILVRCPVSSVAVEKELEKSDIFLGPSGANAIRLSIASIPESKCERVAQALADAFKKLTDC